MKRRHRAAGKWTLRGLLLVLLLLALGVATLAFPYPLFPYIQRFSEFTVCSSRPLPNELGETIAEVRERIEPMEFARPGADCRIFICGDQRLYSVFAFLTRRSPNSMAIGLSLFGNMYLNEDKIHWVAARNSSGIRHSRFEGHFAEVIAHEIAHFNVVKRVGYRAAMTLPVWKSEGYAEYQANLAPIRTDSTYVFTDRIGLMLDDEFWGSGESLARRLFEWHLLVEFLGEIKGFGLDELSHPAVTEIATRVEMLSWYEEHRSKG